MTAGQVRGQTVGSILARVPLADSGLTITFSASSNSIFTRLQTEPMSDARYQRITQVMNRYSERFAREINELAWEHFTKTRRRPGVSTKRLEAALKDPRNVRVMSDGFYAGVASWLDNSPAKYWRQIELGYTGHVGRRIVGVWGSTLTGAWATSERGNRYALTGPAFNAHGMAFGQKFQPLSTWDTSKVKRRHRAAIESNAGEWGRGYGSKITRPIDAQHYYREAFADFRRRGRVFQLWREVVAEELGLRSTKGVGRSWDASFAQL